MSIARTARRWYLAAAVTVFGVLAGAGVLTSGILLAIDSFPTPFATFNASELMSVSLDHGNEWAVYAEGHDVTPSHNRCKVGTSEGVDISVITPGAEITTSRGGHAWTRVATFTTDSPTTVTISCAGTDGVRRYGVADHPDVGAFVGWLVGGILGIIVLPTAGIVTGIAIVIIGRRRNAAKRTGTQAPPVPADIGDEAATSR